MGRRKYKLLALYLVIMFVIIICMSPPFVQADIKTFDLDDSFEDIYYNKIYNQYENRTIKEYFTYELGDTCDFNEDIDKEGFVFREQTRMTSYSDSVINGIYSIKAKKDVGGTSAYIKFNTPTHDLNVLHYSILEIKVKVNTTVGNPYLVVVDDHHSPIWLENFYLTTDWITFTNNEPYNLNHEQNHTKLMLRFGVVTDNAGDTPAYKFDVDYIYVWRNNVTDFMIQEENDSWDFDEGDNEGWTSYDLDVYTIANHLATGETDCLTSSDGIKNNQDYLISNDYNQVYIYVKTNRTQQFLYWVSTDVTARAKYFTITTDWTLHVIDLSDWIGETVTETRIITTSAGNPLKMDFDYVSLSYDNFEDDPELFKWQEKSSTRANKGLNSFYHNYAVNYIVYEGFEMNYNSSIIVDFISLSVFPQRIAFHIYANFYFKVSLFIGTTEYILEVHDYSINDWRYIGERIDREDYVINDTDVDFYLKITPLSQFSETHIAYLDNLEVDYTDIKEDFVHDYGSRSGTDEDYAEINATNSYFNIYNSGENPTYLNGDTLGFWYSVQSNEIFSRRMKLETNFDLRDTGASDVGDVFVTHDTSINITIDKEYYVFMHLEIDFINNGTHDFVLAELEQSIYVDDVLTYYQSDKAFIDLLATILVVKLSSSIQLTQIDHHTFQIFSTFENDYTGNKTSFRGISFNVNDGTTDSGLNILSLFQKTSYIPTLVSPIPPVYSTSKPEITQVSSRDISHSEPITSIALQPYRWHVWNVISPFRSIWNVIVSIGKTVTGIYNLIVNFMALVEEIKALLSGTGGSIGDVLSAVFELLGVAGEDIGSILSTIIGGFANLGGLLSGIGDVVDGSFFDNMFSPFADSTNDALDDWSIIDDFGDFGDAWEVGDWEDMSDTYVNFLPTVNNDFISSSQNMWGGFWVRFGAGDIKEVPATAERLFTGVTDWLTILIVIYLVWMAMLIGRKDWDRMSRELSRIVGIIVWILSAIMKFIHWIFEIIWAILDIIIPFT